MEHDYIGRFHCKEKEVLIRIFKIKKELFLNIKKKMRIFLIFEKNGNKNNIFEIFEKFKKVRLF